VEKKQLCLIFEGEGREKQECTVRLHKEAWKVLMDANIEDIVSNNKRITDEEIKDPRHLDVVIKGKGIVLVLYL
jgi:hypothetical protein